MLRSMTGYGRSEVAFEGQVLVCEVQSVNRKGIEILTHFPREFLYLEISIKKLVREYISRGQVSVRLTVEKDAAKAFSKDAIIDLHKNLSQIAKEIDPSYNISFDTLLTLVGHTPYMQKTSDKKGLQGAIQKGFQGALQALIEMKSAEGEELNKELVKRLEIFAQAVSSIENSPQKAPTIYQEKLKERLSDLQLNREEDRDRILREIVIYCDKIDTTEELVRLKSHVNQFEALLKKGDRGTGKSLEFLLQEMMRETNTLASKAADIEIIQKSLHMKGEIEKLREQVQNVE